MYQKADLSELKENLAKMQQDIKRYQETAGTTSYESKIISKLSTHTSKHYTEAVENLGIADKYRHALLKGTSMDEVNDREAQKLKEQRRLSGVETDSAKSKSSSQSSLDEQNFSQFTREFVGRVRQLKQSVDEFNALPGMKDIIEAHKKTGINQIDLNDIPLVKSSLELITDEMFRLVPDFNYVITEFEGSDDKKQKIRAEYGELSRSVEELRKAFNESISTQSTELELEKKFNERLKMDAKEVASRSTESLKAENEQAQGKKGIKFSKD